MAKAKRPDKERLKKLLRKGMSPLGPAKKAPVKKAVPKKKKKLNWVEKLKARVKEHFAKERQARQNTRDTSIGRQLRQSNMAEEDIIKMGYAPKKKGKK